MLQIKEATGYLSLQNTLEEIWKQKWLMDILLQTQDSDPEGDMDSQDASRTPLTHPFFPSSSSHPHANSIPQHLFSATRILLQNFPLKFKMMAD